MPFSLTVPTKLKVLVRVTLMPALGVPPTAVIVKSPTCTVTLATWVLEPGEAVPVMLTA